MFSNFFVAGLALALTVAACSPATLSPHTAPPTCTLNVPLKGAALPTNIDTTRGAYLRSKNHDVYAIRGGRLISDIFIDIDGEFQTGFGGNSNCIAIETEVDRATGVRMLDAYCWMQGIVNFPATNCSGSGGLRLCSPEDIKPGQLLGWASALAWPMYGIRFFRVGINPKTGKEATGYRSNAIEVLQPYCLTE